MSGLKAAKEKVRRRFSPRRHLSRRALIEEQAAAHEAIGDAEAERENAERKIELLYEVWAHEKRRADRAESLVRRAAPFINAVVAMADDKTPSLEWMADASLAVGAVEKPEPPVARVQSLINRLKDLPRFSDTWRPRFGGCFGAPERVVIDEDPQGEWLRREDVLAAISADENSEPPPNPRQEAG